MSKMQNSLAQSMFLGGVSGVSGVGGVGVGVGVGVGARYASLQGPLAYLEKTASNIGVCCPHTSEVKSSENKKKKRENATNRK
ncbi:hypothetical protein EVAR_16874_1 [Eumeta japonica]|uniref:Uncharacterized protein n=1 Tax=Eumeta variegata TaxID=151549 RepID=A0A4C1V2G2_EUMVA|nr:hypothetical protein EVAR_16874_1 [Eumeta japonica]